MIKTKYKTELKLVENPGEIKEGQCFIVKKRFNYGREKGDVYRLHAAFKWTDGKQAYAACRLRKDYRQERHGTTARGNVWIIYNPGKFMKWFEKGSLAFCDLEEVKKVAKKVNKPDPENKENERRK